MRILRVSDAIYEENCYIVIKDNDATIIDPGFNYRKIVDFFDKNGITPSRIILTHGHIDHIFDIDKLSEKYKDIPIYIHEQDSDFLFDGYLNCSSHFGATKTYPMTLNVIQVKGKEANIDSFKAYLTPGHTRGSMVIKIDDKLFTGDTLFAGSIGRSDLPTASESKLKESLEFIKKSFSKSTTIYPGHYNMTTLKKEIDSNPYLIKKHKGFFSKW